MTTASTHIQLDTAVIGGGVAGLWVANRLKSAGFNVALFEADAFGCGQTLASQGMIHGGMKYTLGGAFTQASETIADMPKHWRACLCGEGDVDLRQTRILSDHFFLWTTDSITSQLSGFLASKLTRGRITPVDDLHYPPLLRHPDFSGHIYKLEDLVLDIPSLVANLSHHLHGRCFKIPQDQQVWKQDQGRVYLEVHQGDELYRIEAKEFIFCAGKANEQLLQSLGLTQPAQQLRPLQQVMVKHKNPFAFFGHCLGASTSPRLTISSHWLNAREQVWYFGGSLAEQGAQADTSSGLMDEESFIQLAEQELKTLVPWLDLTDVEWHCLPIDRAEAKQPGLTRPDTAFAARATGMQNLIVGWPTKLTLAPNLANQVLDLLGDLAPSEPTQSLQQLQDLFPAPEIASPPWVSAFPPSMSAEERLELMFPERAEDEDFDTDEESDTQPDRSKQDRSKSDRTKSKGAES